MKLHPHPDRALRDRKIVKHWFDHRERWWEVVGLDLVSWHADWTTLRGADLLHEGPVEPESEPDRILQTAYTHWHWSAEQACDDARKRATVYPTERLSRVCYVGLSGVTVIVARGEALVTAFRVVPYGRKTDPDRFDAAAVARAERRAGPLHRRAVRHAHRGASLGSRSER